LRNDNEIGEHDLRTAKLLLKYGANPNLETAEVSPLKLSMLFLSKSKMKSLLAFVAHMCLNTILRNFPENYQIAHLGV
jgi:hypothetical protein